MFSTPFLRKVFTSIVCLVASVEDKHCSNLSNVVIGEHNKLIIRVYLYRHHEQPKYKSAR